MNSNRSIEEQVVASAVASLGAGCKRAREEVEYASASKGQKVLRLDPSRAPPASVSPQPTEAREEGRQLKLAPFYFYRDYSSQVDDDPLTPLTPPARVPNFPAKMHAILSRSDLSEIVAWMPHGRSWRVLKPREFEVKVIPIYFEHSKFSSFIRQANGWGFRRITQGRDRNSYYHELFLRGLPHLCKQMKRPGVSEKVAADPDHEPDFYKVSEIHPVPDTAADDDSIMLHCTIQGGPKARMPVLSTSFTSQLQQTSTRNPTTTAQQVVQINAPLQQQISQPIDNNVLKVISPEKKSIHDQEKTQIVTPIFPTQTAQGSILKQTPLPNMPFGVPVNSMPPLPVRLDSNVVMPLSAVDRFAFSLPQSTTTQFAAAQASSQFAAGFAAATALSNNMRQVLGQAIASTIPSQQATTTTTIPTQQQISQTQTAAVPAQTLLAQQQLLTALQNRIHLG